VLQRGRGGARVFLDTSNHVYELAYVNGAWQNTGDLTAKADAVAGSALCRFDVPVHVAVLSCVSRRVWGGEDGDGPGEKPFEGMRTVPGQFNLVSDLLEGGFHPVAEPGYQPWVPHNSRVLEVMAGRVRRSGA